MRIKWDFDDFHIAPFKIHTKFHSCHYAENHDIYWKKVHTITYKMPVLLWIWRCIHPASSYDMYKTNKMHKILVIRLYFPLNALHVSDYISPSSGATFISCTSHLVYVNTCGYSHTTATRIDIYQMRCTAYKSCFWRWTNIVRNMYSI